jgi:hypothetical protein
MCNLGAANLFLKHFQPERGKPISHRNATWRRFKLSNWLPSNKAHLLERVDLVSVAKVIEGAEFNGETIPANLAL